MCGLFNVSPYIWIGSRGQGGGVKGGGACVCVWGGFYKGYVLGFVFVLVFWHGLFVQRSEFNSG